MAKKHILLIDDEVDFAETLALQLKFQGYEVSLAHSGTEGLKAAGNLFPDLILLDVMMPVMDGYAVCSELRKDEKTRFIPVIMLTARGMVADKVEGLKVGADDYVTKSSNTDELFARVEAVIRRKEISDGAKSERASFIKELRSIIEKEDITVLCQPIYDLKKDAPIGHEILMRGPEGSRLHSAPALFSIAVQCGMLLDLEYMVRRVTLSKSLYRSGDGLLFINNNPAFIYSRGFAKEVLPIYDRPDRIVFEVTEDTEIADFDAFSKTIRDIKERGFKIALDDVGSGFSSLNSIAELDPDYAKMDMRLVQGVDNNAKKRSLIKTIAAMCAATSITTIAEGVETAEELRTLKEMGVDCAQGYFLGRPTPAL